MAYNPREFEGVLFPGYDPFFPGETWWKVEGYNDDGSRCTYGNSGSQELAEAFAIRLQENGDGDGRKYDHYVILELQRNVWVKSFVHEVGQ